MEQKKEGVLVLYHSLEEMVQNCFGRKTTVLRKKRLTGTDAEKEQKFMIFITI